MIYGKHLLLLPEVLGHLESVWPLGDWGLSSWGQSCRHCVLMWLTLNRNPDTIRLTELPWLAVLFTCCYTSLLEKTSADHAIPLAEDNWKLGLVSSAICPLHFFSFADLNMCFFTIVNHSHELLIMVYYILMKSQPLFWVLWVLLLNHQTEGAPGGPIFDIKSDIH